MFMTPITSSGFNPGNNNPALAGVADVCAERAADYHRGKGSAEIIVWIVKLAGKRIGSFICRKYLKPICSTNWPTNNRRTNLKSP